MTRTLSHRGPDGEGYFIDVPGGAGLGHRRLSIIDLEGGAQPLDNEDGSIQTVVNGEIYNFQGLRAELISRGHVMKTRSDCEVVAHGYEEWGTGIFEKIDGMFALAIWDAKRRKLLLARDRIGKKPLYYALVGPGRSTLIFGSELAAMAAHPDLDRGVSPSAFAAYLSYECFPEALTAYAHARKLLPGTWLEHDAAQGAPSPALLEPAFSGRALGPRHRRVGRRSHRRAPARSDPRRHRGPLGRRRSPRRVPLGRHRLLHRGGGDGRAGAP
jgi:asparagine synthase (glutamine-hydrolysing)